MDDILDKNELFEFGKQFMYQRRYKEWEMAIRANGRTCNILVEALMHLSNGDYARAHKICNDRSMGYAYSWITEQIFSLSPNGPNYFKYLRDEVKEKDYCYYDWKDKKWDKIIKQIEEENKHPILSEDELAIQDISLEIEYEKKHLDTILSKKDNLEKELDEVMTEEENIKQKIEEMTQHKSELIENTKNVKSNTPPSLK